MTLPDLRWAQLLNYPSQTLIWPLMTSFDLQTLERIVNFRDEFLNQTEQDDPKFPFAVVRNKTDLYDEGSSVTEQKSEQYFNEHFGQSTCKHFSTSAKVNARVRWILVQFWKTRFDWTIYGRSIVRFWSRLSDLGAWWFGFERFFRLIKILVFNGFPGRVFRDKKKWKTNRNRIQVSRFWVYRF